MRIKLTGAAPQGFMARFKSSDTSAEIDGDAVNVEITVPGLTGNKGNSILRASLDERHDMLDEIAVQAQGKREATPAECVRRTAQWEDTDDGRIFSFQTSLKPGSRTHRVPEADVPSFLATLADRFDAVEAQVEALNEEGGE